MPTLETAVPAIMLAQTRIIRAPRARVYAAWTNPEVLRKWFGSATMECAGATLDVREGGAYRIELRPRSDTAATAPHGPMATGGTYTKVVPNELLQFTWDPAWNPGEDSLVTVSFKDADGGTEITVRHERFASEQSRDGHNSGWTGGLDRLAAMAAQL